MTELAAALVSDSYAATPSHILEGLTELQAQQKITNLPHSIYEELWHLAFWQQVTLDWIVEVETPYPARPEDAFPTQQQIAAESFSALHTRFLNGSARSAAHADDQAHLDEPIRCPSRPGHAARIMSIRDQLISLAAHNAYHLGRIVQLRQLLQAWPPPSGGFSW